MSSTTDLRGHDVPVAGDNPWQRTARKLQSSWRAQHGWEPGQHDRTPLGSRLTTTDGDSGRNYLTPAALAQVRQAVRDAPRTGALIMAPRIWTDLLSSQPLCFNLFGDMAADLELATAVLARVWPGEVDRVRAIHFEHSPGRGDTRYLGNRSAFDVVVDHDGPAGRTMVGIEVKYHENMQVSPAKDKGYADIARQHDVFREDALPRLAAPPLQQLWLDHLLALQVGTVDHQTYTHTRFVLLHPCGNTACARVAEQYAECLTHRSTFSPLHLETVVSALTEVTGADWVGELQRRYLG